MSAGESILAAIGVVAFYAMLAIIYLADHHTTLARVLGL